MMTGLIALNSDLTLVFLLTLESTQSSQRTGLPKCKNSISEERSKLNKFDAPDIQWDFIEVDYNNPSKLIQKVTTWLASPYFQDWPVTTFPLPSQKT